MRARAPARPRAPRPPKPQARPSPTAGRRHASRGTLSVPKPPARRSPRPSGSGPPAPARRCVGWACCPPQTHSLAAFPPSPEPSPGDVTAAAASALPAGPASPPGASVLPPQLQDRQDFLLTAPWAPSYIQPSRPMGAEGLSRENRSVGSRESRHSDLKGTLRAERETAGADRVPLVVGRRATPMGSPPCGAELRPGVQYLRVFCVWKRASGTHLRCLASASSSCTAPREAGPGLARPRG